VHWFELPLFYLVHEVYRMPVNDYVFPPLLAGFSLGVARFESLPGDISSRLNLHGFTQCIEENTGAVPVLRHYHVIPNPVSFIQL
jgi:hypothetical protein